MGSNEESENSDLALVFIASVRDYAQGSDCRSCPLLPITINGLTRQRKIAHILPHSCVVCSLFLRDSTR